MELNNKELATEVFETVLSSTLKFKFDCGIGDNGKSIIKTRSFSNVKEDATSLDVFNVVKALISLQQHYPLNIFKQDTTELN